MRLKCLRLQIQTINGYLLRSLRIAQPELAYLQFLASILYVDFAP
jgi:hypothetical protein